MADKEETKEPTTEEMKVDSEKVDSEKAEEGKAEEGKAEEKATDVEMAKEEAKEADAPAAEEAPKEPEAPKELEEDASPDTRPKAGCVDINTADATLNCMPTQGNKVLMTLTEGGFQYLMAGVRANVGLKSGRYMFEAKILELHRGGERPEQQQNQGGRAPPLRNLVRIGVSTAGSSLFLGDGTGESMSFDSEGFFVHERQRRKVSKKFGKDTTVALLVNLDSSSPHANTISLFIDGERATPPQPIPEKFQGKPLIPTITYKNVTLQVNFGPNPITPLPFTCHMLSSAAADDVKVEKTAEPADGKFDVMFPVGLPEKGYFDWVDAFVEQNPHYQELSDRKIVEWAVKSGLQRPKQPASTDKPDMKFGFPSMHDLSIKKLLTNIAPTCRRNFIIPELQANLMSADRKAAVQHFSAPGFKKTATVILGEPSAEHKLKVQDLMLAQKRRKAEAEKRLKAADAERTRLLELRKKKAEEARKAREAQAKRKADGVDAAADEPAEEPAKESEEPAKVEEEIVIELTEEEKKLWYRPSVQPDMADAVVAKFYTEFSIPTREEGFDEIKFAWQPESASADLLKQWIFQKKLTQRVEDIAPSQEFKEKWSAWTKFLQEWRQLHSQWKDQAKRKALLAKRAEAKKKEAEEKGEELAKDMEIDMEDLDVHGVEDIKDVGTGEPLFANFTYEDWTLLSSRYELHLLLRHFKKDLNDPDRPSFTEKDLAFYYNRYFRKTFTLRTYGLKEFADFVELLSDSLQVNGETKFLESTVAEDKDVTHFVKLAEEHRRDRQRRLDAGDETAELKFPRNTPAPPSGNPPRQAQQGQQGGHQSSWVSKDPRVGQGNRTQQHQSHHGSNGGGYHSSRPAYGSSQAQKRPYSSGAGASYSNQKYQRR